MLGTLLAAMAWGAIMIAAHELLAQRMAAVAVRLCTVPGVGPVTAAAFVTTLDDVARFRAAPKWPPTSASSRKSGARETAGTAGA